MAGRGCGCGPGPLNEDNARFLLLAALIVLYLLGGAAVFSALELAHERQAKQRWEERLANFSRRHNLSRDELRGFLRHYEEATEAGIRVANARPRWDFTGAFYFVGTVVSTIGKRALQGKGCGGGGGPRSLAFSWRRALLSLASIHLRAEPGLQTHELLADQQVILTPCVSQCGSRTRCMSVTCDLVTNVESRPLPRPPESESAL